MSAVKQEAKDLIDDMPENITWDDLMYEIYVKQKISLAITSIEEGKTIDHEEVVKKYQLK